MEETCRQLCTKRARKAQHDFTWREARAMEKRDATRQFADVADYGLYVSLFIVSFEVLSIDFPIKTP